MRGAERVAGGLANRLVRVHGLPGVTLGAAGGMSDADVILGLYYRQPLDTAALRLLSREVTDEDTTVGGLGAPGPDGGAPLSVDGVRVGWVFRDLDLVQATWRDCGAGRYTVERHAGHPHGWYSHAFVGEVALGRVLADPTGELGTLARVSRVYPAALAGALVAGGQEAPVLLDVARKGVGTADVVHVAGCLSQAVHVLTQALHGRARRWLVHASGAVDAAGVTPCAPPDFAERCHGLLARTGRSPDELEETLERAEALVAETLANLRA